MADLTGIGYVGCIYRLYEYYARGNSVDTGKRLFSLPDSDTEITINSVEYSYPKEAIGTPVMYHEGAKDEGITIHESTKDIYTEMSASGSLSAYSGLFSAEVSAKYSESHSSSSYFYHVEKWGYKKSYKVTLDLNYALNNLDPDFKDDLYNMDAGDLVAKYGTHFLYEAEFGGRWSYTQSVSKFIYSSSEKAEAAVEANYGNYSGKIENSYETDESETSEQSNGQFWCIGGDATTLTDGFDTWVASVPGNDVLMGFTSDSVKQISELVEGNDARKDEIEQAIKKALEEYTNSYTTTELTTSSDTDEFIDDNRDDIEVDSGSKEGSVVVGFGALIEDKQFTRIAVCYLDLSTGERDWEAFEGTGGDPVTYNKTDYEILGTVPDGYVVTGIGLTVILLPLSDEEVFHGMVLHCQQLTLASSRNNYLDTTLKSYAFQGTEEKNSPESSYDIEFNPDDNNNMVITGIGVGYRGKKGKVNSLKLYRTTIVEKEVEEETEG
ncbi:MULTISPECIES: MAC/perforin domain-containing protein [unclassified Moorena]|uniref:MAC/perforin domain-containing protein n=1 Tax=unclassified Moorena TaxID=2683338 RepID=UPI0013BD8CE8|nr:MULTISPECIES: MAC/perforin domain-containing protein [unclassified Moorena]NEP36664.1 hypothetical protein [Moorena sp. SIO3B2]NEQ10677.1 hypothetical protein [Moorena sp. SIO4E2]